MVGEPGRKPSPAVTLCGKNANGTQVVKQMPSHALGPRKRHVGIQCADRGETEHEKRPALQDIHANKIAIPPPPPHNNVEILRMAKRGTYSPDDSARQILAPAAVLRRQLGPAHDIERRAYQSRYSPPVKMSNMLKHSPPIRCSVFTIWIIAAGPPLL